MLVIKIVIPWQAIRVTLPVCQLQRLLCYFYNNGLYKVRDISKASLPSRWAPLISPRRAWYPFKIPMSQQPPMISSDTVFIRRSAATNISHKQCFCTVHCETAISVVGFKFSQIDNQADGVEPPSPDFQSGRLPLTHACMYIQ